MLILQFLSFSYPNYEVIGDPEVSKLAAVSTRYTDSSLNGILREFLALVAVKFVLILIFEIVDIDLLSKCDFLVCTFSSQVCRLAYEISK
jgi:glycoprotein 6-alpha-L-fucosyltransferase